MTIEKYGMCPCDDSWGSQKYKSSHKALDFGWLNNYGANRPVKAWKSGVVVQAGQITETINGKKYYPTVVVLKHDDGKNVWITRYWHLVKDSCKVKKGDKVVQGQVLGTRGNTGYSNGVHLHFEIWKCPKGYSYSASGYSKYAQDPAKLTYLFDGQIFHEDSDFILEAKPVEVVVVEPTVVVEDIYKHQIEVVVDSLRVRTSASTKGDVYCTCPKGFFNVLESKEADGYVWVKIEDERWIATQEGSWTKDKPAQERKVDAVEANDKAHQVEVVVDQLRVKTQPSTSAEVYCMCSKGVYNVLQETAANGYTWYEIENGKWIATKEGEWTIDKPVQLTAEEKLQLELDKANQIIADLNNKLAAANNKVAACGTQLENKNKEVAELTSKNTEANAKLENIRKAGGWK